MKQALIIRRIISSLIVITMCMSVIPCFAADHSMSDTAKEISNYFMLCLKGYRKLYEDRPYSFSDEYVYALYYYCTAFEAANNVYDAELKISLPESGKASIMSISSMLVDIRYEMSKDMIELLHDWESGEITRTEYLEKLIKYVDTMINVYDKDEQESDKAD